MGDRVFNKRKPEETPETLAKPLSTVAPAAQPDLPMVADDVLPSLKETPMARSPFATPLPTMPTPAPARTPLGNANSGPREDTGRRTLVVGRGISVQGTVQDAERLVVEGTVEAGMINGLGELSVALGGMFKGEVEVDDAEIGGVFDGTITARNALIVRNAGRVVGVARCRRLQVEDGGQITGRIEMLGDAPSTPREE